MAIFEYGDNKYYMKLCQMIILKTQINKSGKFEHFLWTVIFKKPLNKTRNCLMLKNKLKRITILQQLYGA